MNTTEKSTTEGPVLKRLAARLLEAQQELDELALQLALGKAEAKDRFEEIKKDFTQRARDWKNKLSGTMATDLLREITQRLDELEERLSKGDAPTETEFKKQTTSINDLLESIQDFISNRMKQGSESTQFWHEIEKFRLKLEILRLKFALKRFILKEDINQAGKDARLKIEKILHRVEGKVAEGKDTLTDLKAEIREAYEHIREALKSRLL